MSSKYLSDILNHILSRNDVAGAIGYNIINTLKKGKDCDWNKIDEMLKKNGVSGSDALEAAEGLKVEEGKSDKLDREGSKKGSKDKENSNSGKNFEKALTWLEKMLKPVTKGNVVDLGKKDSEIPDDHKIKVGNENRQLERKEAKAVFEYISKNKELLEKINNCLEDNDKPLKNLEISEAINQVLAKVCQVNSKPAEEAKATENGAEKTQAESESENKDASSEKVEESRLPLFEDEEPDTSANVSYIENLLNGATIADYEQIVVDLLKIENAFENDEGVKGFIHDAALWFINFIAVKEITTLMTCEPLASNWFAENLGVHSYWNTLPAKVDKDYTSSDIEKLSSYGEPCGIESVASLTRAQKLMRKEVPTEIPGFNNIASGIRGALPNLFENDTNFAALTPFWTNVVKSKAPDVYNAFEQIRVVLANSLAKKNKENAGEGPNLAIEEFGEGYSIEAIKKYRENITTALNSVLSKEFGRADKKLDIGVFVKCIYDYIQEQESTFMTRQYHSIENLGGLKIRKVGEQGSAVTVSANLNTFAYKDSNDQGAPVNPYWKDKAGKSIIKEKPKSDDE